jgi:omega-6 fatty acid desaturase (delta-12 desaturase)
LHDTSHVEPLTRAAAEQLARYCKAYCRADDGRAVFQLVTTLILFFVACATLIWGAAQGHWLVLLLAIPAGGLLVRLFTFQHDCGHGSFFTNRAANTWVGRALSVLTVTPYGYWRRSHALHHASAGDLSRRGIGDVDTLTVREYRALSAWPRLKYRVYRNPIILHVLGPPLYFLLLQRSPVGQALPMREAWRSIMGLDAALLVLYGALAFSFGPVPVAIALVPVACVASWVGGWLFFVQHQFEHTRWDEGPAWNYQVAALGGSSHYVLPRVLQWFTGDVGLHHIHHLNSRIPNYHLRSCLEGDAVLGTISRLTLRESLSCIGLALWDEDKRKLVSFSHA